MNALASLPFGPSSDSVPIASLPHNLEAEQALLGALMFDNAVFERLSDRLRGSHFYEPFHQRLYEAIEDHIRQGMLAEPAILMVASHGVNRFDHAAYEKMAKDDTYRLTDYRISDFDVLFPTDDVAVATYAVRQSMDMKGKPLTEDVFDSSTWVRMDGDWRCVAHTETRKAAPPA